MQSLYSSPVVNVDFQAPTIASMVNFTTMDMWEESGKVKALASVTWENASMRREDCELVLTDQKNSSQSATYDRYVNQRHMFKLSSNLEGKHSFAITCCNPLMKAVFRGKPSYRKTMCTTTSTKEMFTLDATQPNVPAKYKDKMPSTLLTTAQQCQPVTFEAFNDTAGLEKYIVRFVSYAGGNTLANTTLPSAACSAAKNGKPGQCDTCVPLAQLSPGDQGLVVVTAVNSVGLRSSANVARYANDHITVRVGRLRLDDPKLIKADKNGIKLSASVYWYGLSLGNTEISTVRVCAQLQDLSRHPEKAASGLPRAFAIEEKRRLRRQLQSGVDRHKEKSLVCENISPDKISHKFDLSLNHGPANHLARYSIVVQIKVTAKSGRKDTRLEHKDVRIFAPFSDKEKLIDSWHAESNFTANTKSVAAHFRSVISHIMRSDKCVLDSISLVHQLMPHDHDVDLLQTLPRPSCILVVGRSANCLLRRSPSIVTLRPALSVKRGSRPKHSQLMPRASGCRLLQL